jgi:hypothetical protein
MPCMVNVSAKPTITNAVITICGNKLLRPGNCPMTLFEKPSSGTSTLCAANISLKS